MLETSFRGCRSLLEPLLYRNSLANPIIYCAILQSLIQRYHCSLSGRGAVLGIFEPELSRVRTYHGRQDGQGPAFLHRL